LISRQPEGLAGRPAFEGTALGNLDKEDDDQKIILVQTNNENE